MSNVVHCPTCGAPSHVSNIADGAQTYQSISMKDAEDKIAKLKMAVEKAMEAKKSDRALIQQLQSEIETLRRDS